MPIHSLLHIGKEKNQPTANQLADQSAAPAATRLGIDSLQNSSDAAYARGDISKRSDSRGVFSAQT